MARLVVILSLMNEGVQGLFVASDKWKYVMDNHMGDSSTHRN